MQYDYSLAKEICRKMGIAWDDKAPKATLKGKELPKDFHVSNLFSGKYDEPVFSKSYTVFENPSDVEFECSGFITQAA